MQYENMYYKVIGCLCYTCLPQSSPTPQNAQNMAAPGILPMAQCLFTNAASNKSSTYTYMQTYAKDKKQYTIT